MQGSSNRFIKPMALATLVALTAGAAFAEDREARLEKKVEALEAEVAELRARDGETWLNERRAEEIKALVHQVLADAETRSAFQESGMTAGWNKNFFLASEDGSFLMKISGQVDLRYIYNNRDDNDNTGLDEDESGFQVRRTKLTFNGHIFDPKLQYEVKLASERDSELWILEDVWASYEFADGWTAKAGRYKQPFLREELNSSSRQLAVERSSLNEFFTLNRGEGVSLIWKSGNIQAEGMFHDGAQSGDPSGLSNDFNADASDYALTGRIDVALAGDLKQIKDFSAWSGEPLGIFAGAAINYEVGETGDSQSTVAFDDYLSYTGDVSVEYEGLNLYGAFVGRNTNGAASGADFDDYGFVVQGGYMVIPDTLEPFARYEWIRVDSDSTTDEDINIITAGANYYFKRHDVKFTLDAVWAMEPLRGLSRSPITASGSSSGLGLQGDAEDQEDQIAIRAQFQFLF